MAGGRAPRTSYLLLLEDGDVVHRLAFRVRPLHGCGHGLAIGGDHPLDGHDHLAILLVHAFGRARVDALERDLVGAEQRPGEWIVLAVEIGRVRGRALLSVCRDRLGRDFFALADWLDRQGLGLGGRTRVVFRFGHVQLPRPDSWVLVLSREGGYVVTARTAKATVARPIACRIEWIE